MKKSAEVVFISAPAIGNLVPAVEFATHLTKTDPRLSATILVITTSHRPLVTTYIESRAAVNAGKVRFIHLRPVEPPSPDQYQSSIAFMCLLIEKHKPHVKDALANLMQTQSESENSVVPVVGIVVDMFCMPIMDVAAELGVPCYLFFASPATFLGFMLHLPSLHGQLASVFDDSASVLTIPAFTNPVPIPVLPTFFLRRNDEDGCSCFLRNACRYKETKGIVVNTFKELEPCALDSLSADFADLPQVYPVGPVVDHCGPAGWNSDQSHENITKWLDKQPPSSVVFLCFGSMGSLSPAQVKNIAVGLERSGYRFVWQLREPARAKSCLPSNYTNLEGVLPDGFLDRTAEIGLVCGWVPQVTILAHKAIGGFVSHCGWNSILESLWYGVPIATWPIYAEQQLNAFEMVRELELSVEIRLDYRDGVSDLVCAEEVEKGVRILMGNEGGEVREKVKKMREMSKNALIENGSSFVSLGLLIQQLLLDI